MKNLLYISLFSVFICSFSWAQEKNYAVHSIPDSLLQEANCVVREYKEKFIVEDAGTANNRVYLAYTILNKSGDDFGVLQIPHDKFTKIKSLEGRLYNSLGIQIAKLSKNQVYDRSFDQSYEFSDNKVRIAKFDYGQYPYTVVFEYDISTTNMMFYPRFAPQNSSSVSVENAELIIYSPVNLPVRYKEKNIKNKVAISTENKISKYIWNIHNIPAMKEEKLSSPFIEKIPIIYTAPTQFIIDGFEGNMDSWEEFGAFNYRLNHNRDVLPETTVSHLQKLIANAPNSREKTKRIYEYMQSKTRYVSIQLGIGGWQTLPANHVDTKGYGDCKALSNYMKAMLKSVGIESYYTLVMAGKNKGIYTMKDFTSSSFNHVILCVPAAKDTIWLECTSQQQPFGFLGSFTADRDVLLITKDGGKMVRTPKYSSAVNTQTRYAKVKITPNNEANVQVTTRYKGVQSENNSIDNYVNASKEEQKKWLTESHINLTEFTLNSFDLTYHKHEIPVIIETLDLNLQSIGTKSNNRLFIAPNLLNKLDIKLSEDEERTEDIYINFGDFIDIDTIQYQLPSGYLLEGKTPDINIKSVFGSYQISSKVENNILTYIRKIAINNGKFPRQQYKELVKFFHEIRKSDNTKIVLLKNE